MKNEFRDLICENSEESNVFLCGIPLDKNASVGKGAKEAPRVLRELSYDLPPLDRKGNLLTKVKISLTVKRCQTLACMLYFKEYFHIYM